MKNEECACLEIEHQKEIKSFKINMARLVQMNYNSLE